MDRAPVAIGLGLLALGLLALGLLVFSSGVEPAAATARHCDLERGERVFAKCALCHSLGSEKPPLMAATSPPEMLFLLPVGPDLGGVIGRRAGTADGFKYSRAMRESEIVWDREQLSRYLENPPEAVPESRMPFAGLKVVADREAVICFLEESKP